MLNILAIICLKMRMKFSFIGNNYFTRTLFIEELYKSYHNKRKNNIQNEVHKWFKEIISISITAGNNYPFESQKIFHCFYGFMNWWYWLVIFVLISLVPPYFIQGFFPQFIRVGCSTCSTSRTIFPTNSTTSQTNPLQY